MIPRLEEPGLMDRIFGFYWKDKAGARWRYFLRGKLLLALWPWHGRRCDCYVCYL